MVLTSEFQVWWPWKSSVQTHFSIRIAHNSTLSWSTYPDLKLNIEVQYLTHSLLCDSVNKQRIGCPSTSSLMSIRLTHCDCLFIWHSRCWLTLVCSVVGTPVWVADTGIEGWCTVLLQENNWADVSEKEKHPAAACVVSVAAQRTAQKHTGSCSSLCPQHVCSTCACSAWYEPVLSTCTNQNNTPSPWLLSGGS